MTPRQLKAMAARQPIEARIISDGCRDYVVQVVSSHGAGLLRRRGAPMRFRSLAEVFELLGRCRVERTVLRQRCAHDELPSRTPARARRFHDQPLALAT